MWVSSNYSTYHSLPHKFLGRILLTLRRLPLIISNAKGGSICPSKLLNSAIKWRAFILALASTYRFCLISIRLCGYKPIISSFWSFITKLCHRISIDLDLSVLFAPRTWPWIFFWLCFGLFGFFSMSFCFFHILHHCYSSFQRLDEVTLLESSYEGLIVI